MTHYNDKVHGPVPTPEQRNDFEYWYLNEMVIGFSHDQIDLTTDDDGYYLDMHVQIAWRVYQAGYDAGAFSV